MNFRLVLYLLGRLSVICALALLIPLFTALYFGEVAFWGFASSIAVTGAIGLSFKGFGEKMRQSRLKIKEAMATVGFGWIFVCIIGALPYYFVSFVGPWDALFESVSGFTTTGVTTVNTLREFPVSILVWRSLTHWAGGVGVIMLFITIMPQVGGGANYLFHAEIPGPASERTLPKIKESAMVIFSIYGAFTLLAMLALKLIGMSWIRSFTLALASVATGGFSFYYDSLVEFENFYVELIVMLSMLAASINFALYYKLYQRKYKEFWYDPERRAYIGIILVAASAIALNLFLENNYEPLESVRKALFQTISIASTTGFTTDNFDRWPDFSKFVLLILMFVGGCSGSTAGGIKISRFIILLKITWAELLRSIHPRVVYSITLGRTNVPQPVIGNVVRFFYLYMLAFGALTLLVSLSGLTVIESMGLIASCMSNIGPAFGIIAPTESYAALTDYARGIAMLAMLLGRLEIFTLLVIMRPDFWRDTKEW